MSSNPPAETLRLRNTLVWPFVGIIVVLSLLIGTLSYRAGSRTADALSTQLLDDTVTRIAQAVYQQLSGANARLEVAMPYKLNPPAADIQHGLDALVQRLWLAATPTTEAAAKLQSPYVYFANARGQFVGVRRTQPAEGEVVMQTTTGQERKFFTKPGYSEPMELHHSENTVYNALERPWYIAAQSAEAPVWSKVYQDFRSKHLVITRSNRVMSRDSKTLGVVAVDLPLADLQNYLATLKTSAHGIAFVAEADGALIAASAGANFQAQTPGADRRHATNDSNPAIRNAWKKIAAELMSDATPIAQARHFTFEVDKQLLQCAFMPIQGDAGLKWVAAVIIPPSDFTGDLTGNAVMTGLLGLLAVATALWLGIKVVALVVGDVHLLANAVQRIGQGELNVPLPQTRHTELAEISQSLALMQEDLNIDQLTGSISRTALLRHLQSLTQLYISQHHAQQPQFALLFLDLNRFKAINDNFGHQAGDSTLAEVAQRLRTAIRSGDLLARFGGDEFVIVLWRVRDSHELEDICSKIRKILQDPIQSLSHLEGSAAYTVGASIGSAFFPADATSIETLIQLADERMYLDKTKDKSGGQNGGQEKVEDANAAGDVGA
jgi:diguanylate cyclase (GGDEF)-like protein